MVQILFRWFNLLFKRAYWLYKPIYFLYKSISDRHRIKIIKSIVKEGDTVLDIGANIGFYTVLLSKIVGVHGKVYAFEPEIKNFQHLKKSTRRYPQANIFNKAVGDASDHIKLYYSTDLNVDHQTYDSGEGRAWTMIEQIKLDELFTNEDIIDFVKIDIQGFDYHAIHGAQELISRSPSIHILGEFWPYGLHKAGSSHNQYVSLLQEMNFTVEMFNNMSLHEMTKYVSNINYYTDFLAYIRKRN